MVSEVGWLVGGSWAALQSGERDYDPGVSSRRRARLPGRSGHGRRRMRTAPGWAQRLLRPWGRPVDQGERGSCWRSFGTYGLLFLLVIRIFGRTPMAGLVGRAG
ncbi:hypothetical protein CesoFtcFv8_001107 [Champsocephalus esox]|uniref:Uncharacterized protein n=1 Tax=Champsocephalus esox TaxID=159716 RepID=A0AAN8D858_9TELE|nr:hypothetical protein CesoFtcFv8_001107 [Champsocephalus esox]